MLLNKGKGWIAENMKIEKGENKVGKHFVYQAGKW
jgi:hypothetical protein